MVGIGYLRQGHQSDKSLRGFMLRDLDKRTSTAASKADINSHPKTSPLPSPHSRNPDHCYRTFVSSTSLLPPLFESDGPVYRARAETNCRRMGLGGCRGAIRRLGYRCGEKIGCCGCQQKVSSIPPLDLGLELGETLCGAEWQPEERHTYTTDRGIHGFK